VLEAGELPNLMRDELGLLDVGLEIELDPTELETGEPEWE